jgi:hypothetical protein
MTVLNWYLFCSTLSTSEASEESLVARLWFQGDPTSVEDRWWLKSRDEGISTTDYTSDLPSPTAVAAPNHHFPPLFGCCWNFCNNRCNNVYAMDEARRPSYEQVGRRTVVVDTQTMACPWYCTLFVLFVRGCSFWRADSCVYIVCVFLLC